MAQIRNAANRKLVGRVGDTTYYVSANRQIARQALNSSNYGESARRTEKQQVRRVRWANLVNFYKMSSDWMKKAFEIKKSNHSDYNAFMSVNIDRYKVALTKDEAARGACVIDAFQISKGSLPSIEQTASNRSIQTGIYLPSFAVTPTTTVAQFSKVIVENNQGFEYGMQLSFVSYQQSVPSGDVPRGILGVYEITLDAHSSEFVRRYMPSFCTQVSLDQHLCATDLSAGGHSYVLSNQTNRGLLVSTQSLITFNESVLARYTSEDHIAAAIKSYGVDKEVFLAPASLTDSEYVEQVYEVDYLENLSSSRKIYDGQAIALGDLAATGGFKVVMRNPIPEGITEVGSAIAFHDTSSIVKCTFIGISDDRMSITFNVDSSYYDNQCAAIEVIYDGAHSVNLYFPRP